MLKVLKRLLDRPATPVRAAVAALALPAAATGLALAFGSTRASTATSLYMLAVVGAAAFGGVATGLAAAVVSFVGLNYFFTPPRHTLAVGKAEDLVALIVFLVVAALVGTLLAQALQQRARAQRAERESRQLNRLSTRLLSGQGLPHVLDEFARATLELFDLARCDVRAEVDGLPLEVSAASATPSEEGESVVVPLLAAGRSFGSLVAVRRRGAGTYGDAERELLRAFAGQAALALERARLDAEARRAGFDAETSRLRASLFSSVTHDLRTPLASIKAGVTSLLDEDVAYDDVQRRELLRTILEETDRLNRLVGNILHLARVRAGGLTLVKELTPVDDVIEAVVRRMRPALASFRVRTIVRPDLPAVWLDPVLIDQVLTNLLENAVRFSSPASEITVAASPWHAAVRVRVTDQGPGIPASDRERVFDEFTGREADRGRGGTGLGLAIARAIVAAHGGRIWIEGAPGGGTAVIFEIPVGSPADATGDAVPTGEAGTA